MPYTIRKTDGYRVSSPHRVHAKRTTKKKAEAQVRLMQAVEHGFKPTSKPPRTLKRRGKR